MKNRDKLRQKMRQDAEKMLSAKLPLIVLWLLTKKEMHGYEIIKTLRENGLRGVFASRVYPVLKNMARLKVIKQKQEKNGKRVKKLYRVTKQGRKILESIRAWLHSSKIAAEFYKDMIA